MIKEEQVAGLLESHGYEKRKYGWVRDNEKGISQAVTLFGTGQFQLFGWEKANDNDKKVYDTGIINIDNYDHLVVLILVFDQYKDEDAIGEDDDDQDWGDDDEDEGYQTNAHSEGDY